ncbi:unnamed protein product, partial [Notodromas monacha]
HGYACPPNFNPADFFIHTLAIVPGDEENCRKRVFELCDAFETSEDGLAIKDLANRGGVEEGSSKLQSIDDEVVMKTGVYKAGWFAQLNAVVWRSFVSISREPLILKVRLFQTVLPRNKEKECNMTFQNAFAVINVFCQELPIFLREHFNGMYRVDVYFLSKMLAELPLFILYPTLFTVITYYMIGLNPEFIRFLICVAIVILVSNCACSFGKAIPFLLQF